MSNRRPAATASTAGPAPPTDVLVAEDVWGPAFEDLARRMTVDYRPELWKDRQQLVERAGSSRAIVVRNRTRVDADLLRAAPTLRVVARAGVGLDNIDIPQADSAGVVVVAALGANAQSVAEHTLALALALARNIVVHDRETRLGTWDRTPGIELAGCTWGVLGAGATGQAVGRLVSCLGGRVLGYDNAIDPASPGLRDAAIELVPLDRVIGESDVISVHLPATEQTRGLVDGAFLGAMRPHALLVNVGRGEVVDERALYEALVGGRIGGAALDVRATEPPSPGGLEGLDNVILTPHVAGITRQSQERIIGMLAADLEALLDGVEARYAVGAHHTLAAQTVRSEERA